MPVPTHGVRHKVPAVQMRAGTSKGLFFKRSDLPKSESNWDAVLLNAMGSPDPFGRQLDGLGGGTSTTSKVAVVGPSLVEGVDLDYTFVAVPINRAKLDFTGNCGNMCSGVGPFAVEEGMVARTEDGITSVTIRNTNTGVVVRSTFEVRDGVPCEDGAISIDGVAGLGGPVRLDFLNPAGSMTKRLLPSGFATDTFSIESSALLPDLPPTVVFPTTVRVSLVDAANPFVFVAAADVGLTGHEQPADLIPYTSLLMHIRCLGAVKMGLAVSVEAASKTLGTPKVAIVGPPSAFTTSSGRELDRADMDLHVRPFSMGQPHTSLQMTGAVCLAAACSVAGSVPNTILQLARREPLASKATKVVNEVPAPLRFAHGSGVVVTESDITLSSDGEIVVRSASVYRTARRLFEGLVSYIEH